MSRKKKSIIIAIKLKKMNLESPESRNGEYEPSREEEEELERALEAVDKDVRNLERMGQTHGLLEPALLAQLMSDIAS